MYSRPCCIAIKRNTPSPLGMGSLTCYERRAPEGGVVGGRIPLVHFPAGSARYLLHVRLCTRCSRLQWLVSVDGKSNGSSAPQCCSPNNTLSLTHRCYHALTLFCRANIIVTCYKPGPPCIFVFWDKVPGQTCHRYMYVEPFVVTLAYG